MVGNPCNTNALIAMENAPNIPRKNFHALTRLDENRAKCQLALKSGKFYTSVSRMAIWGNHSTTQVGGREGACEQVGGRVGRGGKWRKGVTGRAKGRWLWVPSQDGGGGKGGGQERQRLQLLVGDEKGSGGKGTHGAGRAQRQHCQGGRTQMGRRARATGEDWTRVPGGGVRGVGGWS